MRGLTLRGYARHRKARGLVGGTLKAVQKALAKGWIRTERDGSILAAPADRSWAQLHKPRVRLDGSVTTAVPRASGGRRPQRGRRWTPSAAQVRRWTKLREQLRAVNGRLAAAMLSPHVPAVTYPKPFRFFYCGDEPAWAQDDPRLCELVLAEEHITCALIELSRLIGYPGYRIET
jgi:hypothetical protein